MLNKININPKKQILIVYVVLTVVTLVAFWQVNQYNFVYDDIVYVTENGHLQSGITLDGFCWAFSTTYAEFWHPLTWLSLLFDYQLHGLNASGYHLTNLILHIMSTLLLFWLFHRMTGAIWRSAFVAALFALHPLHVESVAWIAERKDVLSTFFWMLTLCLYVYYTEKPVIRRYLPVFLCFACALMSKPMVITLPIVMILLDYWPLERLQSRKILTNMPEVRSVSTNQGKKKKKEALKKNISPPHIQKLSEPMITGIIPLWQLWEKIPFFILSAVFAIITIYAHHTPPGTHFPFSLGSRIANAIVSFATYLEKTFWPHDLAVFYPFPAQILAWQVIGASLLIIVISAAAIAIIKRLPYLFVGWLWFAITLLPVIGIMQIGDFSMADRYTYLPLIGLAVMLAWGIPTLIKSEEIRKKLLFPAGVAAIAILAVLTWQQCAYWKNDFELFNHALQVTKNNYIAHNNLGLFLFNERKIEEAIDHYNQSINIRPNYEHAYYNRGLAYYNLGQYQRAIEDYNEAIRLNPNYVNAYLNRGNAYHNLSQYQRAIEEFNEVIRITSNFVLAYYNRGNEYNNLGQYQRAIEDYNEAIRLNPNYSSAYINRGAIYSKLGQYQRAIEDYNEAIRLNPNNANAYNNRGLAYLLLGNKEFGCVDAQKACALGNCKTLETAKDKGYCH